MQDAINEHVDGKKWHEKPYSDRLKYEFDEKYKEIANVKINLDKKIDDIYEIKHKVLRPIHTFGSAGTYPQREEIADTKNEALRIAGENINKKMSELQKISKLMNVL